MSELAHEIYNTENANKSTTKYYYHVTVLGESCGHKHRTERAAKRCCDRITDNGDIMASKIEQKGNQQ